MFAALFKVCMAFFSCCWRLQELFLLGKHDFKLMINLSIPVMKNKMILKFTYFKPTKIYVFGKLIKFCT